MKSSIQNQIIQVMSAFAEPVNFNEIHTALDGQYKERNLRRWLGELAVTGLINKTGQKKGTQYQLNANEHKMQNQPNSNSASDDFSQYLSNASRDALARVQRPIFTRQPVTYNDDWIERYIPNQTFYLPAMPVKNLPH